MCDKMTDNMLNLVAKEKLCMTWMFISDVRVQISFDISAWKEGGNLYTCERGVCRTWLLIVTGIQLATTLSCLLNWDVSWGEYQKVDSIQVCVVYNRLHKEDPLRGNIVCLVTTASCDRQEKE